MSEDRQVTSSRTKMYGVQIGSTHRVSGFSGVTQDYADGFSFIMKNGSDAGDILFQWTVPKGKAAYSSMQMPANVMFGSNYILFPDGIFAKKVGGDTASATQLKSTNQYASFIYEAG